MASNKGPVALQLPFRPGLNLDSTAYKQYDLLQVIWHLWLFYFLICKTGIIIRLDSQGRIAE